MRTRREFLKDLTLTAAAIAVAPRLQQLGHLLCTGDGWSGRSGASDLGGFLSVFADVHPAASYFRIPL